MQIIDLSHAIHPEMPLFSTEAPQPKVRAWMSHAKAAASGNYDDCSCEISEVNFITSTGTYLDSPYHFDLGGVSIEEITLEQVVLPGIIINCKNVLTHDGIGPEAFNGKDISGKAVLFNTGWSRYWGQPTYYKFPFLLEKTAIRLKEEEVKLVGVDFLVIDDTANPRRPVHNTLLKQNILIVENLTNLDTLPEKDFIFHAAPVKFKGAASFPVRAYAVVN